MPHLPSGRRRGGQPGNTHRLRHGLYSRRIPRTLTAALDPRSTAEPDFEIALARVRLVQLIRAQQTAPAHLYLTYERAVIHYLDLIFSLTEAAARRRRNGPELQRVLDALRHSYVAAPGPAARDSNLIRTSAPWPETSRD
jgi:hypothetical protein